MPSMKTHSSVLAKTRHLFGELPRVMRVGLCLATLGAAIDIAYHIGADTPGVGHDSVAFIGHMVTLIGMVVTMLGLIGTALRGRLAPAKQTKGRTQ